MNYYPHHIGDFRSGTFNMTRQERWIYRDMIDVYYDTEGPFPDSLDAIYKMMGVRRDEDKEMVAAILLLKFELRETGYHHVRCDEEIAAYRAKAEVAKSNGAKGGRPPKNKQKKPSGLSVGSDPVIPGNPAVTGSQANQEPITSSQNKETMSEQSTDEGAADPVGASDEKPRKHHGSEEDQKAARWMFDLVRKVNATAREPKWDAWANDVRLMREIDGRTHHDICELFRWAKGDGFWCANIQSPGKLREKWDVLVERRARPASSGNGRPSINNIGVAPGADDDIFNQMRKTF